MASRVGASGRAQHGRSPSKTESGVIQSGWSAEPSVAKRCHAWSLTACGLASEGATPHDSRGGWVNSDGVGLLTTLYRFAKVISDLALWFIS